MPSHAHPIHLPVLLATAAVFLTKLGQGLLFAALGALKGAPVLDTQFYSDIFFAWGLFFVILFAIFYFRFTAGRFFQVPPVVLVRGVVAKINTAGARKTLFVCTTLFAAFVVLNGWQCDDAYHSHKMSYNLANGDGFVYNIGERVTASTCPLWSLLVAGFYKVFGHMFVMPILLCAALSTAALFVLLRTVCRTPATTVLATLLLAGSFSFVSFTTSGLENALLFFLWALLLKVFFGGDGRAGSGTGNSATGATGSGAWRRLFFVSLLGALILMTRMDHGLLLAPLLLWEAAGIVFGAKKTGAKKNFGGILRRVPTVAGALALGFLPFLAWEIFSVLYYGFPFPNTAYVKVGTGFPRSDYLARGLYYFADALLRDALLLFAPAVLFAVAIARRAAAGRCVPVAAGIAIYWIYLLCIGGDFMTGRHFTATYFIAVFALFHWREKRKALEKAAQKKAAGAGDAGAAGGEGTGTAGDAGDATTAGTAARSAFSVAGALVLGFVLTQVVRGAAHSDNRSVETIMKLADIRTNVLRQNVWDERNIIFNHTSLAKNVLRYATGAKLLYKDFALDNLHYITEAKNAGYKGDVVPIAPGQNMFYHADGFRIYDRWALWDPFLAHLPAQYRKKWRTGHMTRESPLGYRESIRTGENRVRDPDLRRYLDAIWLITRSPEIFSRERLRAIWRMNTGGEDHLLAGIRGNYAGVAKDPIPPPFEEAKED
ncbi:MAG: hypothetical protein LBR07_07800 [Puniceicoccales bacterium]|jgi:arabinofuranosyltransferase|nr:hypothetical protein [Puniceicoccales bacterium]